MKLDSIVANSAEELLIEMEEKDLLRGNTLEENFELFHDVRRIKEEGGEPMLWAVYKCIAWHCLSERTGFEDAMRSYKAGRFFQLWRLNYEGCFFVADLLCDADSVSDY